MPDFKVKYARALDELTINGVIYRGNWFLDALNWPLFKFQLWCHIRPIYYTSFLGRVFRCVVFMLFIAGLGPVIRGASILGLITNAEFIKLAIVFAFVGAFCALFIGWRASSRNLSDWDDL